MSTQFNEFSAMVNEIVDYAILTMDKNGHIQSWNSGAQRIKAYKSEEIIGENFRVFYTQEDLINDKPQQLLNTAIFEGRASDEGWRKKKDGSLFWASVTITAVHDDIGNIIGFTKVTRDLTQRRATEIELLENSKKLLAKNKELEQFAYIASHDLQEPLRTILNCSDILSKAYSSQLDDNGKKFIHFISDASNRMSQLIKGLLDYSRLGQQSEIVDVDCNKILDEIEQDLQVRLSECNGKIQKGSLPIIKGYEIELRALFQNLITNAMKFRKEDTPPVVRIISHRTEGGWQFSVKDNGIGIPGEHLDRIFKIFQRIHTREKFEGHGIGLAHCSKIAELHKGRIWAESNENEGSIFHFTINI